MRLELLGAGRGDTGDTAREVGAAVVRPSPGGGMVLELGPADGPPQIRLTLSTEEATRLTGAIHSVASGRNEEIVIVDR